MIVRHINRTLEVFVIAAVFSASVFAQITITIPKIPKIKRPVSVPTITQTQPEIDERDSDASNPVTNTSNAKEASTQKAAADTCGEDWWIREMAKDIGQTRKEAEEFRPGQRDYFVSTLSDSRNKFLEAALSTKRRQDMFADAKLDDFRKGCMNALLDDLASVAKKTLPGYTGPAGYTLGTPAEKKLLLGQINDIAGAKVLKVGIKQPNWLIAKDDYNLPTARYKHGVIWAQYPNNDTGFCWIFWVNLVQDYAGGGTYAASYGNYISRAVAGCPAGK